MIHLVELKFFMVVETWKLSRKENLSFGAPLASRLYEVAFEMDVDRLHQPNHHDHVHDHHPNSFLWVNLRRRIIKWKNYENCKVYLGILFGANPGSDNIRQGGGLPCKVEPSGRCWDQSSSFASCSSTVHVDLARILTKREDNKVWYREVCSIDEAQIISQRILVEIIFHSHRLKSVR